MEGISRLLMQAAEQKEFSYDHGCRISKLNHLSFAEIGSMQKIIFCKAEMWSVQTIMSILRLFGEILGLEIRDSSRFGIRFGPIRSHPN